MKKVFITRRLPSLAKEILQEKFDDESLLGALDHGYYDDISLGADYFSGHAVIERPGEHKVTDLGKVIPVTDKNSDRIGSNQKTGKFSFRQWLIFGDEELVLEKYIEVDSSENAIIRPYSFTFNPEIWDRENLYVATHNGGSNLEKFYLKGQHICHGDIYSSLISARHCFGCTEGVFVIGDRDKSISFKCDMSVSALIPSIIYKEIENTYFLRLQYSAREMDETIVKNETGQNLKFCLKISFNHDWR
jgi:hypothetical protein